MRDTGPFGSSTGLLDSSRHPRLDTGAAISRETTRTRVWNLLFSVLLLTQPPAWGADDAREKRLADELANVIIEGESVFLEASGRTFWGIHTEPDRPAKGAAIVLHGRGLHPDWPAAAAPARTGLAKHGWATLSFQLPRLEKGKGFD